MTDLTIEVARKVLTTVDAGLVSGQGLPVPGGMCVEAAVCFALGLPHGDNPPCVGDAVRAYKIRLNDQPWSSDAARAKGMRRVAIAQLGSNLIDQRAFAEYVALHGIKRVLPIALRAAASRITNVERRTVIEATIPPCEQASNLAEAREAANAAHKEAAGGAYAAYAAADAAAYAAYAADAADAANTGQAAGAAAAAAARDKVLSLAAEIAVEALQSLNCQGCGWLSLCDEHPIIEAMQDEMLRGPL